MNIAIVTDAICGVVKLYMSKQLYASRMAFSKYLISLFNSEIFSISSAKRRNKGYYAGSYRPLVPSREQSGEQPPPLTRICLGGREYSLESV